MTVSTIEEPKEIKEDVIETPAPMANYFAELADINVNEHLDKKNGFSYLSWAHAVDTLKRKHPDAQIIVKRFPEPESPGILVPYYKTKVGYYVEVDVIVNGISVCEPFPVTNYQNKPIASPTNMDINNSIQRAKVKMIAGHGLGLYVYAGEDVPKEELQQTKGPNQASSSVQGKTQQPQQQSQQQPQQQPQQQQRVPQPPPATAKMTQEQEAQLRNLVTQIAALKAGQGASQEVIVEQMKAIYAQYKVVAGMSYNDANTKINGLTNELNTLHINRMKANTSQTMGMFANASNQQGDVPL